eukprot:TRINITY_DN3052_c0_g2_i1.p1 TRINITY_DN3052_c0_g2~~TRINITY_DN3052_c0_g2_i1.p1  ORF type:complete len:184 (+),score=44.47 TRINITY_DN3052_c0_g2_i1:47-598(+)
MEDGAAIALLVIGSLMLLIGIYGSYRLWKRRARFRRTLEKSDEKKDKKLENKSNNSSSSSSSSHDGTSLEEWKNNYQRNVNARVDTIRDESKRQISKLEDRIRELENRPVQSSPPRELSTNPTFVFSPQSSNMVSPTVVMASHDLGDPEKQAKWQQTVINEMLQNKGNPEVRILSFEDSKILV